MKKLELVLIFLVCIFGFSLSATAEQVPREYSDVYVDGSRLMVSKRIPSGSLSESKPYVIKGVTWSPSTRAPKEGYGPDDSAKTKLIPYGFFFDSQGNKTLAFWKEKEYENYYKEDIALMKDMHVNTVRTYSDFGIDPEIYNKILDEFYANGIMVILTVANSQDDLDLQNRFFVYRDAFSSSNHYIPSGWMGDYGDLSMDDKYADKPREGLTCIKLVYAAKQAQNQGWAGVYWQNLEDNWGNTNPGGFDLSGCSKLTFWAKGESGGEKVEFKIGGISGQYPDSATATTGVITLSSAWQKYTINLTGKNLSHIIGGFCFVVTPPAKTFYIDDIQYEDYPQEKRFEKIVGLYKNHPAILMWSLGNEWNLNKGFGYSAVEEAGHDFNLAAKRIKEIDSHHPVTSCLGDVFDLPTCELNDLSCDQPFSVDKCLFYCPEISLWGINVYRGQSFGELFKQWENLTLLPFYVSEFGTDSFKTSSFDKINGSLAGHCQGSLDESTQADFDVILWREIEAHLSAIHLNENCLGGLIHEFNDELWKVGNYHAGLGGLLDYEGTDKISGTADDDTSYDEYNFDGFYLPGGAPDNVLNEEYFGLVTADRIPKAAYLKMKGEWLEDAVPPTGTIAINYNAPYTNNSAVTLRFTVIDKESGMGSGAQMRFSIGGSSWSAPEAYATFKSYYLPFSSGVKTVYVKFKDVAGNWSSAVSDSIILDITPPAGTIKINNGAAFTGSSSVVLNLSATDAGSGMGGDAMMKFSIDNYNWSTPEAYKVYRPYGFPPGDGTKTVYVKFKDAVGNWSNAVSDTIILDTFPPNVIHTPITSAQKYKNIIVTAKVNDISGVQKVTLCWRKWIQRLLWWEWSDLRSETMFQSGNSTMYNITCNATLFGNQTKDRKIKYYINAGDKAGHYTNTPEYVITRY